MTQEVFKQFMEFMKPFMKSHGFTKKNNNFYKRHPQGNIGIINFQKGPNLLGAFYINVSVYSRVLAEAFLVKIGNNKVKKYPSECDGHWRRRIESLVPEESPYHPKRSSYFSKIGDRWEYDENTNVESFFQKISHLIAEFAIPAIDQRITDEQLKSLWFAIFLEEEDPGSVMLRYLATLLYVSGEEEKLNAVLNRLGKIVQDNPQRTILKRQYASFIKERKWIDEAYVQELELYWSKQKKRKKKQ